MGSIKEINIKIERITFLMIWFNIKDFDSSLLKIDKKSYKNIGIYNIGYITMKRTDENIHSVNLLCLMIGKVIRHMEENNRNKYLVFDSSGENRKTLK